MNVQINLDELQNYPDTGAVITHIREQIANGFTYGKFPEWKLTNKLLHEQLEDFKNSNDFSDLSNTDINRVIDLLRLTNISFQEKQSYKSLESVETGDIVICNYVHLASTKHLTKGNKYEVLNTDNYRFMIQCDSGVKKWYHLDNGHFKALK